MAEEDSEVKRADRLAGGRSLGDLLSFPVERAFIKNLANNRLLDFLINPAQFEDSHAANYVRHGAPGLSHKRMQFVGNDNVTIPMDLIFDELIFKEREGRRQSFNRTENVGVEAGNRVEEQRRKLLEFVYPRRGQRLSNASPPPLLFNWPGMINMRVRLTKVRFRYLLFQVGKPLPRVMVASVELEEEPMERIFSENMLRQGTFRPWGASSAPRRRGS